MISVPPSLLVELLLVLELLLELGDLLVARVHYLLASLRMQVCCVECALALRGSCCLPALRRHDGLLDLLGSLPQTHGLELGLG
eukprot:6176239-Alexandrium_andersonii.AAC.1